MVRSHGEEGIQACSLAKGILNNILKINLTIYIKSFYNAIFFEPLILLPGSYPKEIIINVLKDLETKIFITVLYKITKNEKI